MAKHAQLPDGTILEFPDETPDAVMDSTVKQHLAGGQPQSAVDRLQAFVKRDPSEYDQNSTEFRAKYGAQSGSSLDNFMAGAGKSVVDLGRGIRQLGTEGLDLVTGGNRGEALRASQDAANERDRDLMSTGAGVAGDIAGNVATTILPAGLMARGAQVLNLGRTAAAARAFANPLTYKAAIAAGGVQGALQPVGSDESRTANVALSAGTGGVARAATGAIGRIAQPLARNLRPEDDAAIRTLRTAGVPLDAAQQSGSRGAQIVKRAIADNPFTSSAQGAFMEKQGRAFTRAVLNQIGENSDSATADVMGRAATRIGSVFDRVAANNPVTYDAQLNHELARVSHQAHRELPSNEYSVIGNQVQEIFDKATQGNGQIIGEAYQNLRTSLGRISSQRSPLGHWAQQLRGVLDDALQRSASGADLADLKVARGQYRKMLQIEGAIDNEGAGLISPSRLANSLGTQANRMQSKYGRGDQTLVKLAQAGKRLLPDKFPNSGTAARMMGQIAPALAAGALTGGYSGDTGTGLETAAGTAALLAGARGGLNNRLTASYLARGIQNPAARNALLLPGRVALPNIASSSVLANRQR